jgi:excisionase family DNA binding protein
VKRVFLTLDEAAELLRSTPRSVRERSAAGKIPHWRPAGCRASLYPVDELESWLASGEPLELLELKDGERICRSSGASS